jgi:hypothetical protein
MGWATFWTIFTISSGHPASERRRKRQRERFYQGCQMVNFGTKIPIRVNFERVVDWKRLIHFAAIWNILRTFGIFDDDLVYFEFIWYIFPVLVSCTKENLATLVSSTDGKLSCSRGGEASLKTRSVCTYILHSIT